MIEPPGDETKEETDQRLGVSSEIRKSEINLYKIVFSHSAPKDTEYGIKCFFLAHNEEEVYDYIDFEYNGQCWRDNEKDNEMFQRDGLDSKTGGETFREKIIRLRGDINDENRDFSDAYYGVSFYGWELVAEDVDPEDFSKSITLGIVKPLTEEEVRRGHE